eukprot:2240026-Rhodomonas_salina.3
MSASALWGNGIKGRAYRTAAEAEWGARKGRGRRGRGEGGKKEKEGRRGGGGEGMKRKRGKGGRGRKGGR